MATRCTKIKLKEGKQAQALEWAAELNRRADEVYAALKVEGVRCEAAFIDEQADGFYLIYIMQADDFEKSQSITQQSLAPIEAYHHAFKKSCWESAAPLKLLIDFDAN